MRHISVFLVAFLGILFMASFRQPRSENDYTGLYKRKTDSLELTLQRLYNLILTANLAKPEDLDIIKIQINRCRRELKFSDFWLRYLEPVSYKKLNGPLPVEWETEVFEKYEKPYKREGAGLSLAWLYLEEPGYKKDSLFMLIQESLKAIQIFHADTVTEPLSSYHHFFFCNRLYLLNLAAIYTTGFESPDPATTIPELKIMMNDIRQIYAVYNTTFPAFKLSDSYTNLYNQACEFIQSQPSNRDGFDHFTYIRDYINPLFSMNQGFIKQYSCISRSYIDYSLENENSSVFSKSLFKGQKAKGVYYLVEDEVRLQQIKQTGKLLFYDPILSGNNERSCASCHKPDQYFADTTHTTSLAFERKGHLTRNTPSLVNVVYNHLLMLDGKHTTLQNQAKDVTTNPIEMGGTEYDLMEKILSCKDYKKAFKKYLPYLKTEDKITYDQIVSAITLFYADFSNYESGFDKIMNRKEEPEPAVRTGFNLFMGKAQCGTCHFVPHFNGSKPPYISTEFEVLGVPEDSTFRQTSLDSGRYKVNPAPEMLHAFRTGSLRNISHTAPFGHNGVFKTLEEVIEFYDTGGGQGKGLIIPNQTLSSDSLHLTIPEKKQLIQFLKSLDEQIIIDIPPARLPVSSNKELNLRIPKGLY